MLPLVRRIEDRRVVPILQLSDIRPLNLQIIEILEEQHPGGLLGVVQLGGGALFGAKSFVDVVEGVFEHGGWVSPVVQREAIALRAMAASSVSGRRQADARVSQKYFSPTHLHRAGSSYVGHIK